MARWQRLYHKHIASLFSGSLYSDGRATLGREEGHCVFGDLNWLKSSGLGNGSVRENQKEDHFVKPKGQAD